MLIFTIRRVVGSIFVLLVVSFITFMFTALTYDPLAPLRARNPPPTQASLDAYAHQLHLDQPVLERYWDWLSHLINFNASWDFISFNFGNDLANAPVSPQLAARLQITGRLIIGAIILAAILAIVLGVVSGVRHDKPFDIIVTILTFVLLALPTFWFAAVLKEEAININQSVKSQFFFTEGYVSPGAQFFEHGGTLFWDQARHLILPVLSLGLLTASGWIRFQRASTIDVLDADYMRLARAKGVRNRVVIRRHGLRNALIPLVTVMAIDIGALFGGAIITEQVYVLGGMGDFLNTALAHQDTYSVIGWVMVSAIFVILFNLLADLVYAAIDPRIRLS